MPGERASSPRPPFPQPAAFLSPFRGSGFQSGTALTINGKAASVTFKDSNTFLLVTPALTSGPQQITLANPDGETASLDAAFIAN